MEMGPGQGPRIQRVEASLGAAHEDMQPLREPLSRHAAQAELWLKILGAGFDSDSVNTQAKPALLLAQQDQGRERSEEDAGNRRKAGQ